jgi:hypothetical protein
MAYRVRVTASVQRVQRESFICPDLSAHNYAGFGQGFDITENALALSGSTPYPVAG